VDLRPLFLSFETAAIATVFAALIGIGVATVLANFRFPGRDLIDVFFTAPIVMPPTVLGYYLLGTIGIHSVIGRAYRAVTGGDIVFTKTGVVVAGVIGGLPLVVKTVRTALEEVDPTLILAARTLGATRARALLTVQLPLAGRGIVAALMLAFARALGDFGVTLMIAGDFPGRTQTAALAIYDALQAQRERDAQVLATVLTVIVAVLLYVVGKLTARPAS